MIYSRPIAAEPIQIDGLDELERNLKALPEDVARKILQYAARDGAKMFQGAAQMLVPRGKTRHLEKGIVVKVVIHGLGAAGAAILAMTGFKTNVPKDERPYYAHMIHWGTRAHEIGVKAQRVLASGSVVYGRTVRVRGITANPFMRTAFDTTKEAVLRLMMFRVKTRIDSVAKKARPKR